MNLPEEYLKLASMLINLSNDDKVKWTKTNENEFKLNHEKVIIEIHPFTNPDEEKYYYYLSFRTKDKKINNSFKVSNWDFGYDILEELYNAASRNAQGIRDAINDFLSDFDL